MTLQLNDLVNNKRIEVEHNPVLHGNFGPVETEKTLTELKISGQIPPALSGTLMRNGPNPKDPQANHHLFLGDAMLHAIKLSNGKALSYRNRWIRTRALEESSGLKAAPVIDTEMLAQGSGNVNAIRHGGRVLALPEIGLPYEVNTELDTLHMYNYEGALNGNMTGHPKIDGVTGEMLFFGYEAFAPFLRYYRVDPTGKLVQSVDIDMPEGVMMHDFSVTATRAIFMDLPVVFDLGLAKEGFRIPYRWDDHHQSRLGILDRNATSDETIWIDIDPCYAFHTVNSYDDGDKIIMDVIRYRKAFTSESDATFEQGSQLVRWTIDVLARTVDSQVLHETNVEFPRVDPRVECHPHRYAYALETSGDPVLGDLFKFDLDKRSTERHSVGEGCSSGEPVFVATGPGEDEGYILALVYSRETNLSELIIIDARDFTAPPVAVVKLDTRVPHGFHGNFISDNG